MSGGGLVVLGGAGGIGRALVAEARARGWRVAVIDLPASLARWPAPDGVPAFTADATRPDELEAAAGAVCDALGAVDGFVHLPGFSGPSRPVAQMDPAQWREVVEGNLTGAFHALRAMAPRMAAGGAMVFASSGLGHFARPGYGPYAASKAGISMLAKTAAIELAPRVRVNAVAPSAVDTAFLRGGTGRSDEAGPEQLDRARYLATIPLGRIAEPRDVVGPILFLLSEDARYMTGQMLFVNGGSYMP